jgi:integrase
MTPRARKSTGVYQPVEGAPNLELNTKTGVYYVRKYRAGKGELFKSTRCQVKGRAKNIAEDMIAEWLGDKSRGRRVRIDSVADDFLADCTLQHQTLDQDGRPLRRLATYKHDLSFVKFIKEHFGDAYADEIDEQYWDEWVKHKGRKMKRTLGDVAKYLSMILGFAFKRKIIPRKPAIHNPDKHKSRAIVYEDAQILEFIRHADPVLKDMIILAAENPLRPHEIREMRWDMLDLSDPLAAILRLPSWFTKTHKDRELVLSPNASQALAARSKRKAGPYVFPGQNRKDKPLTDMGLSVKWHAMLESAGITERYLFHWLRHSTYSKLLLDARLPVQHVSEAGGTSISTLQRRYLKSDHTRTRAVSQALSLKLGEEE